MDYDKTPVRDVHEVAGVIKLYFRELAEPLVPTAMMREFVSAGANGMLMEVNRVTGFTSGT